MLRLIAPASRHVCVEAALAAIIAPEGAPTLSYLLAATITRQCWVFREVEGGESAT